MKANDKRQLTNDSPSTQPLPLKGSDYFPPGAGWNRGNGNRTDDTAPVTKEIPAVEPRRH